MYAGFPADQLELLRCPNDGAAFTVGAHSTSADRIVEGVLTCSACGHTYRITGGILDLLDRTSGMDDVSTFEMNRRDEEAAATGDSGVGLIGDIAPSLRWLAPAPSETCLEIGCGTGRFTTLIADHFRAVVAVDFSMAALCALARRLDRGLPVGLVRADATRLGVSRGGFDKCLSTLVSNLPSPAHRRAMFRVVAGALRSSGRFVFGAHFYSPGARRRGRQQSGTYDNGIYRYLFDEDEILGETRPFFGRVRVRRACITPPAAAAARLGRFADVLCRVAERIPVLNDRSEILVAAADEPVAQMAQTAGAS